MERSVLLLSEGWGVKCLSVFLHHRPCAQPWAVVFTCHVRRAVLGG
jgi:hypothetical protein